MAASTFERVFEGPVRRPDAAWNHISVLAGHVLVDEGKWRLWYGSTTGFVEVDGKAEPQYQIKYAESLDGRDWMRPNITCIEYKKSGEANGRPCVIKENGLYRMWYCYRGTVGYRTDKSQSYRLGYAESLDGIRWERLDHLVGLEPSQEGWDSMMVAYPLSTIIEARSTCCTPATASVRPGSATRCSRKTTEWVPECSRPAPAWLPN